MRTGSRTNWRSGHEKLSQDQASEFSLSSRTRARASTREGSLLHSQARDDWGAWNMLGLADRELDRLIARSTSDSERSDRLRAALTRVAAVRPLLSLVTPDEILLVLQSRRVDPTARHRPAPGRHAPCPRRPAALRRKALRLDSPPEGTLLSVFVLPKPTQDTAPGAVARRQ